MDANLLSRLPRDHRRALRAHSLAGLTVLEVAALLRCSPGRARGLIERGLDLLRDVAHAEGLSMNDQELRGAALVAAECPVRICAELHRRGDYYHCYKPQGRVMCLARDREPPAGAEPTAAQQDLWDAQETA